MKIPFFPLITEKSLDQSTKNKYTFMVDKKVNKSILKELIEKFYRVQVIKINLFNQAGKRKRMRFGRQISQRWGKRKDIKKAIVSIKKGQKIKDFEINTQPENKKTVSKSNKKEETKK